MFSIRRGLLLVLITLIGIGISRGWFRFSTSCRQPEQDKVNICVSVDAKKMGTDIEKFAEKVGGEVARRPKQPQPASSGPSPPLPNVP